MSKSSEKTRIPEKSTEVIYCIIDENVTGGRILNRYKEILKTQWETALKNLIFESKSSPPIQIKRYAFENGVMKITLGNEECHATLKSMVTKMGELCKGAKLKIVPEKDVPMFYKVTFHIEGYKTDYTSDSILKLIGQQNKGLNVDVWTLLHRNEQGWMGDNFDIVYAIDFVSSETLGREGQVYFMSSTIPYIVSDTFDDYAD